MVSPAVRAARSAWHVACSLSAACSTPCVSPPPHGTWAFCPAPRPPRWIARFLTDANRSP